MTESPENSSGQNCAICRDKLAQEGISIVQLRCTHSFHQRCADEWLLRALTCPICRAFVRDQPAPPRRRVPRLMILHGLLSFTVAWVSVFYWAPAIVPPCRNVAILALLLICVIRLVVLLVCVMVIICRRCYETISECSTLYAFASVLPLPLQALLIYGTQSCDNEPPPLVSMLVYEGAMAMLSFGLLLDECISVYRRQR